MKLKVNQNVYKYLTFGKIGTYVVLAQIKREKSILYEIESLSCQHGYNCKILIKPSEYENDAFEYVDMVYEEEGDNYSCFHKGERYYLTLEKAIEEKYLEVIRNKKREKEKHIKAVEVLGKEIVDMQAHLLNIQNKHAWDKP